MAKMNSPLEKILAALPGACNCGIEKRKITQLGLAKLIREESASFSTNLFGMQGKIYLFDRSGDGLYAQPTHGLFEKSIAIPLRVRLQAKYIVIAKTIAVADTGTLRSASIYEII